MSVPFVLEARNILQVQTALSMVIAAWSAPPYNLALHLFGVYAIDQTASNDHLRLFAVLLGLSAIWDIVWMARHDQGGFIRFVSILILVIKLPSLSTVVASLRQRGDFFASRLSAGDLGGSTIWSMPGGFTRQGYDSLDVEGGSAPFNDVPAATAPAGASRIPDVVAAPRPHQHPPQSRPAQSPQVPRSQPPGTYESV